MSSARNWLTRREALALAGGLAVMAMIPENPVVGGTVLRRQAIQSPNFVTGSAGWAINQDGSAEFNNVVIRNGQVISGTALYYSGAPALGNLLASVAAAAGTDSKGNAYLNGITSYSPSALGINFAISFLGGGLVIYTGPSGSNGAGPWTSAMNAALNTLGTQLLFTGPSGGTSFNKLLAAGAGLTVIGGETADTVAISSGQAAGKLLTVTNTTGATTDDLVKLFTQAAGDGMLSARVTGDTAARVLIDTTAGGLAEIRLGPGNATQDVTLQRLAATILQLNNVLALRGAAAPAANAGVAELFATGNSNQPSYINPQGLTLRLTGRKTAVVNTVTVTQAALTGLFSDTIPAADAEVGAVYQIDAYGFGTWGSTQQQLTLGIRFGAAPTNVIGTTVKILNTALAAGAAFEWYAKILLTCVTTGVTATWRAIMTGAIQQTANPLSPGVAANNAIPFSVGTGPTDITLDSTIAETFGLSAQWASTTGAPTITRSTASFARKA